MTSWIASWKTVFHGHALQQAFLNEFFTDPSLEWANDLNRLLDIALSDSELYGLAAMDALHFASALLLRADEFVTTEKPGKTIYRVTEFKVLHVSAFHSSSA